MSQSLQDYFTDISQSLAAEQEKMVKLVFSGLDEFDMTPKIFEILKEAGEVLIRNSIEHGLEFELDRILKHKDKVGRTDVELEVVNDTLSLSIHDDGKGLNFSAIRARAHVLELIDTPLGNINRDKLIRCLFTEKFSTKENHDQLKSNAVGLSHVKALLKTVRGRVSVRSSHDEYCQFKIKLPMKI